MNKATKGALMGGLVVLTGPIGLIAVGIYYLRKSQTEGGDIKDQIATFREGLSDADESRLYGETLINPTKGIKRIRKAAKKEGYSFDKNELGDALNEMDQAGEFFDVELDDAALASLFGNTGAIGQAGAGDEC